MEEAQKLIQEILKTHSLKIDSQIAFPQYKILPDEVKLAMIILAKHGMRIQFVLNSTLVKSPSKK